MCDSSCRISCYDGYFYSEAIKFLCICILVPITLEVGIYSSEFYSFIDIALPFNLKALILILFFVLLIHSMLCHF